MILLLLACVSDSCDAMCDAALARFSACLEEGGLEWGDSVGYESPTDYTNWCATWTWEARELDEADTCETKRTVFTEGDCAAYRAAWVE